MVKNKQLVLKSLFLSIIFCFGWLISNATIQDSIGIEKKNNKIFVLHQVEIKETLYSISRKYASKVEDIKTENPEIIGDIKIGQIIRIPYKSLLSNPSIVATSSGSKIHTVEKKETLYSISKLYNIPADIIIKANPGIENGLKEGQELRIPTKTGGEAATVSTPVKEEVKSTTKVHIVEAKETLFGISKKYDVSVDDLKKANPQLIEGLQVGMEIKIPSESKAETPVVTKPAEPVTEVKNQEVKVVTQVQNNGEFKKYTEKGMAELLENNSDSPKFQALHKTAPVGTIIQVLNEVNGQKIFVRVIGKLTNASDGKTVIKLSLKAMERLEIKEKKAAVTLTYIP